MSTVAQRRARSAGPAGHGIQDVRPIRDEIDRRVLALIDELVGNDPNN